MRVGSGFVGGVGWCCHFWEGGGLVVRKGKTVMNWLVLGKVRILWIGRGIFVKDVVGCGCDWALRTRL